MKHHITALLLFCASVVAGCNYIQRDSVDAQELKQERREAVSEFYREAANRNGSQSMDNWSTEDRSEILKLIEISRQPVIPVAETANGIAPFLPPPWDAVLVGIGAAAAGLAYNRRKRKESKNEAE